MKGARLVAFAIVMFLTLGVGSVYANTGEANLGLPILGTTGVPALAAPSLFSGVISVLYADGTPVVLESNRVTLDICSASSCITVPATLKQTAPGTYTYSFTPPSLTGTVTIYIKAYALADDNGKIFPQVDTSIGSYAYTPSTTSSTVPPATSLPSAGTPVTPRLTTQAVNAQPTQASQPTPQASPIEPLLIILSSLAVAGSLLVVSKRH
ncbi:MAG TPA: hypothetical protein VEI80_04550 [Candidatus Acidoferrales bacterium]|nr:hypothetical protein [Candidatus Acidoferrales bacterium]